MAGGDSQKQFLTLIRDFAAEKSQGERRISGLKKQIAELSPLLEAAHADLEEAKRHKETAEQELKGLEVELNLNETSIQTLQARISLIQDEISAIASDLECLKAKENASRDEFLSKMYKLNAEIRNFHKNLAFTFSGEMGAVASTELGRQLLSKDDDLTESKLLEDKLTDVISQLEKEEQDYQVIKQELTDLETKITLMDSIAKETKEWTDVFYLTKNKQNSELEEACASLGEELQKRCVCPSCHRDNVEELGGLLQADVGS
ncbi:hypothetical protein RJ641_006846 [Dillenia turbinata]|uniref:Uncharacterized protein n=1 Tax=Dillenia turbinata TaxID=194707 RepID=A0AAN8V669_9MAGN